MKLTQVDFYMDWPRSIEVINLRQFIMDTLIKQGTVIRWSIIDIKDSADSFSPKKLRIIAVLANSTKLQI